MNVEYTKEQLQKFIKKQYHVSMIPAIEFMQIRIKELEEENKHLRTEIETARNNYDKANKSLAMEIGTKMLDWMEKCSLTRNDVHSIVEDDVKNKLNVSTESEWVEYSGQSEHYHKTISSWDGEVFNETTD